VPDGLRRDDGCGCVDTPLLQSPVELRSRLEHALASSPLIVLPAFARPLSGSSSLGRSSAPARAGASGDALFARRSVVLLV
jgi:hypothetical protein